MRSLESDVRPNGHDTLSGPACPEGDELKLVICSLFLTMLEINTYQQ